jgi:hypothetical protein
MTKKYTFLSLFFIFFSLTSFSNARLFPGYYIDLKGDSIHCNIEFNDWNLNPKIIKVEVNGNRSEFTPADIRGFGVNGFDDYLSATVQYHTAPVSGKDVPTQFSDSVSKNTFFLKILNRGFYSLYDLVSTDRTYLFMQRSDSSISELVYRTRNVNDSLLADQQYKNVILSLFVQEGIGDNYFTRVSNTSYTASDVQSLFDIVNESHGGYRYHKKSNQEFQIQLYAGGIRNSFPTAVAGIYNSTWHFDPAYSFTGGVNFLYSIPGKFKAFKVGLSVGYSSYKGEVKGPGVGNFYASENWHSTSHFNDTLTTKNSLMQTNFYLMYVVNPLSTVMGYVKAGVNYSFSLNTPNQIIEKNSGTESVVTNGNPATESSFQAAAHSINDLKNSYLTPMFGVGMIVGRSTLEFAYYLPAELGGEPNGTLGTSEPSFKVSSMSLSYYFSVFRTK